MSLHSRGPVPFDRNLAPWTEGSETRRSEWTRRLGVSPRLIRPQLNLILHYHDLPSKFTPQFSGRVTSLSDTLELLRDVERPRIRGGCSSYFRHQRYKGSWGEGGLVDVDSTLSVGLESEVDVTRELRPKLETPNVLPHPSCDLHR